MNSPLLSTLGDHLWQSNGFAAAIWLTVCLLRSNRAGVRYALWMTASLKFLAPFSLLLSLGKVLRFHPKFPQAVHLAATAAQIGQPFTFTADAQPLPSFPPRGFPFCPSRFGRPAPHSWQRAGGIVGAPCRPRGATPSGSRLPGPRPF